MYCEVRNNIIVNVFGAAPEIAEANGWLPLPEGKEVGDYYDDTLVAVDFSVLKHIAMHQLHAETDRELYILAALKSEDIYANVVTEKYRATANYTCGSAVIRTDTTGMRRVYLRSTKPTYEMTDPAEDETGNTWIPVPKMEYGMLCMPQGVNCGMYIHKNETVCAPDLYTTYTNLGESGVYTLEQVQREIMLRAETQWRVGRREIPELDDAD